MSPDLIPPQSERVSVRAELVAACLGALIGAVFGGVMWFATNELEWLYAVPICALIGPAVRSYRPNILWGEACSVTSCFAGSGALTARWCPTLALRRCAPSSARHNANVRWHYE
jgi:hypothetical protein